MRNKITADFAARFGIDFLSLPHERRKGWRVAAREERVFGHATSMPEPQFTYEEIIKGAAVIASCMDERDERKRTSAEASKER
jgi:hypothetical protein